MMMTARAADVSPPSRRARYCDSLGGLTSAAPSGGFFPRQCQSVSPGRPGLKRRGLIGFGITCGHLDGNGLLFAEVHRFAGFRFEGGRAGLAVEEGLTLANAQAQLH